MMRMVCWKPAAGIIALYIVLAGALACTKRPWADEAWFANMSVNLLEHGKTGISVLDPRGNGNMFGREFPGINQEYYIWIPVQQSFYALCYRFIGFGFLRMHAISMLWGLLALFAWFAIALKLTDSIATALLTIFLVATDFAFLDAASDGRMDMMCASLAYCGLAAYLLLRQRHLERAIMISQALCVIAGLTHPMGAIGFTALLFLTVYMDHSRLRWRHLGLASIVYLAAAVIIAAYILPNVALFKAQLGGALTGRLGIIQSAGNTFIRELTVKYRTYYLPPYATGVAKLRAVIPAIYGFGMVGALSNKTIRTSRGPILGLAAVALLTVSFLDSGKLYYYLVHSTPYLASLLALWVSTVWMTRKRSAQVLTGSVVAAIVALQLAWVFMAARKDPYHKSFLPMAAMIQDRIAHRSSDHFLVMSSAEIGFVTGFNSTISDDALLGYKSKHQADIIIIDQRIYGSHQEGMQEEDPEFAKYLRALLSRYSLIYTDGYYKVYSAPSQKGSLARNIHELRPAVRLRAGFMRAGFPRTMQSAGTS